MGVSKFKDGLFSFMSTVIWCLSLSWKSSKLYTVIRILADIIIPIFAIATAFIGKYILDLLSAPRDYSVDSTLLILFSLMLSVALLRMVSQKAVHYSQAIQSDMINAQIALDIMERSLSADLEHFDNPDYYDRLQSASQDSITISYILWNVLSCISASVAFLGAFAVLYQANALYGLVMLGAAIPASIAAAKYTKELYMLSLEQINEQRKMSYFQYIASDKSLAQDIRLYEAGGGLKERYSRIWKDLFVKRRATIRKRSILTGVLECLPEIVVILVGVDIAFGVFRGTNTVGDYVLFMGLAGQLWSAILSFSSSSLQIYDNRLKIDNIKALDTFVNRVQNTGKKELEKIITITFDRVTFTYPETVIPAINNVSFTLHKDEKVVLVGLNGSGKSTIIKLLLRMYDPDSGTILINGEDIKEFNLSELRRNFSVYFQEMHNYSFTLRENFTIADEGQTDVDNQITAALRAASGDDIIDKAQKGMNTSLTRFFDPEGIEFSGGQNQKIALARAFFRRHSALILDEPSSNLDPKAEYEIFETLKTITKDKMTLYTSHRLSNVSLADRILVLEKGKLVEDGTQAQLLKNKHRYAELFQYQKDKYNVDDALINH